MAGPAAVSAPWAAMLSSMLGAAPGVAAAQVAALTSVMVTATGEGGPPDGAPFFRKHGTSKATTLSASGVVLQPLPAARRVCPNCGLSVRTQAAHMGGPPRSRDADEGAHHVAGTVHAATAAPFGRLCMGGDPGLHAAAPAAPCGADKQLSHASAQCASPGIGADHVLPAASLHQPVHAVVIAPIALLWPFLTPLGQARYDSLEPRMLVTGARLHVVLQQQEGHTAVPADSAASPAHQVGMHTLPARLLGSFRCHAAGAALRVMLRDVQSASGADPDAAWQLDWALGPAPRPPHDGGCAAGAAGHGARCHDGGSGQDGSQAGGGAADALSPGGGAFAYSEYEQAAALLPQQQAPRPRPPPEANAAFALLEVTLAPGMALHTDAAMGGACGCQRGGSCCCCSGCGWGGCGGGSLQAGMPLSLVGAPFGCLSPSHFARVAARGCIMALLPQSQPHPTDGRHSGEGGGHSGGSSGSGAPLFAVDAATFPGMEGSLMLRAPSACARQQQQQSHQQQHHHRHHQQLPPPPLGLLVRPLSRRCDGVQVNVAVAWPHVVQGIRTHLAHAATRQQRAAVLTQQAQQLQRQQGGAPRAGTRRQPTRAAPPGAETAAADVAAPEQTHADEAARCGRDGAPAAETATAVADRACASPAAGHDDLWIVRQPQPRVQAQTQARAVQPVCGSDGRRGEASMDMLAHAARSVVLVRTAGSWASGVVVNNSGVVLTNAHVLATPRAAAGRGGSGGVAAPPAGVEVAVRLACGDGTQAWRRARVLFVFRNHLDVAVLQLPGSCLGRDAVTPVGWDMPGRCLPRPHAPACSVRSISGGGGSNDGIDSSSGSSSSSGGDSGSSSSDESSSVGDPSGTQAPLGHRRVLVFGHGLFGPSAQWPAAASLGNITKVVHDTRGIPSLMLTSASVHSGASGAPVVDADTGQLLGLVTSNARHAGGATLPRLNFAIAWHALAPLLYALRELPAWQDGGGGDGSGGGGVGAGPPEPWNDFAAGLQFWADPFAGGMAGASSGRQRCGGTAAEAGDLPASVAAVLRELDRHDEGAARVWALRSAAPHDEDSFELSLWGSEQLPRSRL